ncbi:response regulator [Tenacibaculum sp. UWU-22]|uniref:hybrid sensor histidine kinase/response regulator transcription factor n=1 Tax=Tenacibaculum sp. UWU-22 TaxID=3234187 RepID=UPI0034DB6B89
MRASKNRLYIFFLLIYYIGLGQNNNSKYLINYISTKEGLPHNYVSQVVSDSLNMKWIASENGLIKYDGNDFTVIKPSAKYPGIKNENIETLFLDKKNNLWIGTKSGGLSRLDIKHNKLENFNDILLKNQTLKVRAIIEDSKGYIWVGTNDSGLFIINPKTRELVKYFPFKSVLSLYRDSHNNIWVANENILKKYNPSENTFTNYNVGENIISIRDLVEDTSRNCLWIATATKKFHNNMLLKKFDFKTQTIQSIKTNISTYFFSSFYLDESNRLWIGTWGQGLYRSNKNLSAFKQVKLVYANNSKKTDNYNIILDIHEDQNKVLWISCDFGGIVKLTKGKGFMNLSKEINDNALEQNLITEAIYKDQDIALLGTLRNGLFLGKNFKNLKQSDKIKIGKISSIFKYKDYFFIGAMSSLYILNRSGKIIASLPEIPKATCYFLKNDNEIWVGTQQKGLVRLNISSITQPTIVKQYVYGSSNNIGSNRITGIVQDTNKNIWIGSYSGIQLYNPDSDNFIRQNQLTKENLPAIVNAILIYQKHIWLCTPGGLYKLHTDNNVLKIDQKISAKDGLTNDFICAATSSENHLWFTTLTNLVKYDFKNNSFSEYGSSEGVYISQFNIRSIFKDTKNIIYVGGTDNLIYFNPHNISDEKPLNREIVLTHLRIDNTTVTPNDTIYGKQIIDKDFSYVKKLKLPSKVKSFSIGFINNDFGKGVSPLYKYKLVGYHNEWVYTKSQNEVNFVGLSPGKYELLLSSSNDSKHWTNPKKIDIQIQYAALLNPLAYIIYAIILLTLISWIFHIILKQSKLKTQLKRDQELSEAKFTFFTNISHEFKTPLTLILAPLKDLMAYENNTPEAYEKLISIDKNATRLLRLINQLLDFRKAGHGLLKLRVSKGNIVRFTNEVYLYFKEQAELKNITYTFIEKKEHISLLFDRHKMEIVLSNLLSNAFKYTNKGGKITLKINADDEYCTIKLTDSGIGMSKDSINKIFDHYFQIEDLKSYDNMGTGIGLTFSKKIIELHHGLIEVESKPNKGSVFTIKLPLETNLYKSEEKDNKYKNSDKIENYEKLPEPGSLKINNKENTVLVVDDNDEIRDYLKKLLNVDYNILEAENGLEALSVAKNKKCDLILCDVMMPKMDGLTACKELKSNIGTSHIPIILLTARSANVYEIKGLNIGADDFISKPFDPYVVKARIASALKNRAKLRDYFLNKIRFEPTVIEDEQNDTESIFLQKVINAIEDNLLNDDFGIDSLTDICFMSQSTLYRKIKSLTGLSLTGFIRSIKLKKAAEMILTEDISLSEISTATGFNDYKYFRVSFIKQFGCLPSKYKEKIKAEG